MNNVTVKQLSQQEMRRASPFPGYPVATRFTLTYSKDAESMLRPGIS